MPRTACRMRLSLSISAKCLRDLRPDVHRGLPRLDRPACLDQALDEHVATAPCNRQTRCRRRRGHGRSSAASGGWLGLRDLAPQGSRRPARSAPRGCLRPRSKGQIGLMLIRRGLLDVRQNLRNHFRLFDAGDHLERYTVRRTSVSESGSVASRSRSAKGNHNTLGRSGRSGSTSWASSAAVSAMRRPPHEGQNPRFLRLNATSFSARQPSQRTRRKPSSRRPHFSAARNSS